MYLDAAPARLFIDASQAVRSDYLDVQTTLFGVNGDGAKSYSAE
ncbi:hypothetical protein ACFQE8_22445 [Salinirubellus sp. GCM10025818]